MSLSSVLTSLFKFGQILAFIKASKELSDSSPVENAILPANPFITHEEVKDLNIDEAKAEVILKLSPRLKRLTIRDGMLPTIAVDEPVNWGGTITYSSALCGRGKVPQGQGYEYMITVTDGTIGGDAAASHGVRDGRMWSKIPTKITSFCVFLVKNRAEVIEYSKVYER